MTVNAYDERYGTFVIATFNDGLSHRCMVDGSYWDKSRTLKARCGDSYYVALRSQLVTCIRCLAYVQERNLPL